MVSDLSARLSAIVDTLPLRPGLRVLEIGCGPGAAAREVAARVGPAGSVLGIDRSERAVASAQRAAGGLPNLIFRCVAVEQFDRAADEPLFDLAFAVRVGVLDGRHPRQQAEALRRIRAALVPGGQLFVDGVRTG
ncbi:class I SAM-dependent methyltransferase [Skermania piniformis]|uniref:Class I SAM-dependent methyltransferase n=1 Tax=Skermania pinensis TaxID=39122 RepID=A0ABX8SDS4_9ACTN|nr:class I SAM-dependent methyltransferase [Skermania piniformis]QXQ15922.1 class I SAM-dependent methyltransferase [Skermania piniformis]